MKTFNKFLEPLYNKTWITYIEPPKGKAENVVEYVGRYSFRVAISNDRIKNIENGNITFEYKDYKDNSKIKEMTITAEEFIRSFLLHVLPKHFTKIKHYGLLSNVTLNFVDYLYLEYCQMNLFQIFLENLLNLNVKIVAQLILVIVLIIHMVDPVQHNLVFVN